MTRSLLFVAALAFTLVGCDATTTADGLALSNSSSNADTVTGPSVLGGNCVGRYIYSNTLNDFIGWEVDNISGTGTIVATGWTTGRPPSRPYADVEGLTPGKILVVARDDSDPSPANRTTKGVEVSSTTACL